MKKKKNNNKYTSWFFDVTPRITMTIFVVFVHKYTWVTLKKFCKTTTIKENERI